LSDPGVGVVGYNKAYLGDPGVTWWVTIRPAWVPVAYMRGP
jgi:hypothetical protein